MPDDTWIVNLKGSIKLIGKGENRLCLSFRFSQLAVNMP